MFEAFFTDSCLRYRTEVINGIDFYGLGFGMVRGESMGKWISQWMQKGETASVLITNTKLPDTSGFEFAERIRSQCPRVRVIFVTDTPSLAEAQQAVRCGAYDYLPKSDGIDALRSTMIRVSEELHAESREEAYLRSQTNWDEIIPKLLRLLTALRPEICEEHWQLYSRIKWYNGHGIDIGRLHRGYWLPVKPGWYYGCGEYGAEGLDSAEVMEECYPREWLREPFDPGRIVRSQTKSFSGFFYDAQEDMQGWISRSQRYQAFATRMMTEAFRRDDRMVSNAIHLFIDAWPSGWMKSIMDCKRIPKQAYFAYRDALAPLLVSLRTDRFAYTAGETIQIEAFLCNDTAKSGAYTLAFELYNEQNKLIQTGRVPAHADACRAAYIASAEFPAETAQDRETLTLRAVLLDGNGDVVNYAEQKLTVFQDVTVVPNDNVVILKLEPGLHTVAGETVTVKPCGMLPLHFVSRKTGHPAVAEFNEQDFSYWYDAKEDCITPLLDTTFTAEGFTPILLSNNMDEQGNWGPVLAAAEKLYEGKHYVICQLDLRQENPVAKRFLRNLYRLGTK